MRRGLRFLKPRSMFCHWNSSRAVALFGLPPQRYRVALPAARHVGLQDSPPPKSQPSLHRKRSANTRSRRWILQLLCRWIIPSMRAALRRQGLVLLPAASCLAVVPAQCGPSENRRSVPHRIRSAPMCLLRKHRSRPPPPHQPISPQNLPRRRYPATPEAVYKDASHRQRNCRLMWISATSMSKRTGPCLVLSLILKGRAVRGSLIRWPRSLRRTSGRPAPVPRRNSKRSSLITSAVPTMCLSPRMATRRLLRVCCPHLRISLARYLFPIIRSVP